MNKLLFVFPLVFLLATQVVGQKYQTPFHPYITLEHSNGIECNICHFVADKVADFLEQNKTETQILTELEKVCDLFGKYEKSCDKLIDEYGRTIIQDIDEYGKDHICEIIGLCDDILVAKNPYSIPYSIKLEFSPACPLCELVVKKIGELLEQEKSIDFIETEMDLVCDEVSKVSEKMGAMCKSFVSEYVPKLIDAIVEKGIDNACDFVGICTNKKYLEEQLSVLALSRNGLDECTICEFVVGEIDRFIEEGKTEQEILDELNKACKYFKKESEVEECDDFLDSFAKLLITLIMKYETPEILCTQLHICKE